MKRFLNTLILIVALSAVAFAPARAGAQDTPPSSPNDTPEQAAGAAQPQEGNDEGGVPMGSRNASGVVKGARGGGSAYGGQVGEAQVEVDTETGALMVITDDETNEKIKKLIENLDHPVQQVLIKVLFLEVTHNDNLDLGAEFTLTKQHTAADGTVDMKKVYSSLFGIASLTDGAKFALLQDDLEMTVRALAEVGKLEVLSRPSIMTKNNEAAVITVGNEVPRITNSRITQDGQTINTVEYSDIGIILDVTPRISPDGERVEMTLAPEISTMTGKTIKISENIEAPVFAKRSAETCVVVPSGRTVVIGGLMENQETETTRKIPLLGDIWVIGSFFQRKITTKAKTELLIFLTPQVVSTDDDLQSMTDRERSGADATRKGISVDEMRRYIPGLAGDKNIPAEKKSGQEAGEQVNREGVNQSAKPEALEPVAIIEGKKKVESVPAGQPLVVPVPQEKQKESVPPAEEKK